MMRSDPDDPTKTDRNLLFNAARFRENCFCTEFISGDFLPAGVDVKGAVLAFSLMGIRVKICPVRERGESQVVTQSFKRKSSAGFPMVSRATRTRRFNRRHKL